MNIRPFLMPLPILAAAIMTAPAGATQPAGVAGDSNRCALRIDAPPGSQRPKSSGRRALMGFARGLAGNLPMLGGRSSGLNLATAIAGQAATAALAEDPSGTASDGKSAQDCLAS